MLISMATHTEFPPAELSPVSAGINTGLSIAGSSGGENQTCSSTSVLFSMYTIEILGRGSQRQGWEVSK